MSFTSPMGKCLIHLTSSASSDYSDNRDDAGTAFMKAQFCKRNVMISLLH